ncbi:MAG TPA: hypothetical protein VJL62_02210 [Thermodesulfobacteriota bacterium]|nr:hypothetical protein [Thermodesulfobacteriota bacterium]
MDKLKSQRGSFSLGEIIFLAVIGTAIYAGILMAIPLVRFYQVEALFKDKVVRLKVATAEELRPEIDRQLQELGVTFPKGYNIIKEEGKPAVIEGEYQVDVDFAGVYKYTYIFKPRGEAPKSAGY